MLTMAAAKHTAMLISNETAVMPMYNSLQGSEKHTAI